MAVLTRREGKLIARIVDRATTIAREAGVRPGRINLFIGLSLAHKHMPLNLDVLADANDVTLAHDVFGIMRHLDPKTGELRDCFVPRTAQFQHKVE
jgi:hypothetical protein